MEQAVKRLTRSRRDRVFGGICGGLAAYLGWDIVLVRVAWVALTVLSGGSGIVLYVLAWLIIPLEEMSAPEETVQRNSAKSNTRVVLGALVVIIGVLALSSSLLPWFWSVSSFRIIGPVILIVLGAVLLLRPAKTGTKEDSMPSVNPEIKAEPPRPPRRMVRIREGRKIAGICTGLGHYFNVDATIIRLFWIVLILAFGTGILLYFLFWIAMPLVEHAPEEQTL